MTVVILDNNESDMKDLSLRLQELRYNIKIKRCFRNIESFREYWTTNESRTDVVFAEITIDGTNIFEEINMSDICSNVIITTKHKEFAVQAFRHNVIDFLVKPIQKDHLSESIVKAKKLILLDGQTKTSPYKTQFQVTMGKQMVNVKIEEISFIECCNQMTYINQICGKRIPTIIPLITFENMLDPDFFFRANRQIIFHFDAVQSIEKHKSSKYLIRLKSNVNKVVYLSEDRSKAFRAWMNR